jgi:hypothetical protein
MMTSCILTIPYFESKSNLRNNECLICLEHNINNPAIDAIILLCEIPPSNIAILNDPKIVIKILKTRPTYHEAFTIAQRYRKRKINRVSNCLIIVANSDIIFDEAVISKAFSRIGKNIAIALSRWNLTLTSGLTLDAELHDCGDSQDSWFFLNRIKRGNFKFEIGIPGCDNRLAHELSVSKYRVINPAKSLITKHLHLTDFRTYSDSTVRIEPPYKFINLTE